MDHIKLACVSCSYGMDHRFINAHLGMCVHRRLAKSVPPIFKHVINENNIDISSHSIENRSTTKAVDIVNIANYTVNGGMFYVKILVSVPPWPYEHRDRSICQGS